MSYTVEFAKNGEAVVGVFLVGESSVHHAVEE